MHFYYFAYEILIIYIHGVCPLIMSSSLMLLALSHSSSHPQHLAQCLVPSRLSINTKLNECLVEVYAWLLAQDCDIWS